MRHLEEAILGPVGGAPENGHVDEGNYRIAPLSDLVRYVLDSPRSAQKTILREMSVNWKERVDLLLYRFLVPGYLSLLVKDDPCGLLRTLIDGLLSENRLVKTSSVALSVLLDTSIVNAIARCEQQGDVKLSTLWLLLANMKWHDLCLSPPERHLLRTLATRTINVLSLAINGPSQITITTLSAEISALQFRLERINEEWRPGQPLLFEKSLDATRVAQPLCVPWGCELYSIEISEVIRHFVGHWRCVTVTDKITPKQAREVVNKLRMLQMTAWLTVRGAHRAIDTPTTVAVPNDKSMDDRKLISAERRALAELALLERGVGDPVRAGIYATLALEMEKGRSGNLNSGALINIASQIGLDIDVGPKTSTQHNANHSVKKTNASTREKEQAETLLDRSLVADPEVLTLVEGSPSSRIDGIIEKVPRSRLAKSRLWERLIDFVALNPDDFTPDEREVVFELAVRLKIIRRAAQIAIPLQRVETRLTPIADKGLKLPARLVVLFAETISTIYQEALPWVNHRMHLLAFRMPLRRMWKACRDEFEFNNLVMIHDALRGQFHAVADRMGSTRKLTFSAYADLNAHERNTLRNGFAERVVRGLVPRVSHADIGKHVAMIPANTVLVSIAIRNGHELSVLIATGDGKHRTLLIECRERHIIEDRLLDWHELAEQISETQPIWAVTKDGPTGRVPWPEDFVNLGRLIINDVVNLNPSTNCIALAAISKLRALPWQHLFSVVLKPHWRKSCQSRGLSRGVRLGDGLLVRHISGLATFTGTNGGELTQKFKMGVALKADNDEPVYKKRRAEIETIHSELRDGPNQSRAPSVLAIFAQGAKDSHFSRILFNGIPVDSGTKDELAGYAFTMVNVCHSGYFEENLLGDMGGWPGYLLAHQSACVVAPISEIADLTALRFYKYVASWLSDRGKTFSEAYLTAIVESADMAFYSVYGDPSIIDAMKMD